MKNGSCQRMEETEKKNKNNLKYQISFQYVIKFIINYF